MKKHWAGWLSPFGRRRVKRIRVKRIRVKRIRVKRIRGKRIHIAHLK